MIRVTTVLLMTILLFCFGRSYAQKITYSGKDVPLETVFAAIKQQTGYVFLYKASMLKDAKPVTIAVKNEVLENVLQLVFKDQPLVWSVEGNTVAVRRKEKGLELKEEAGSINISGTIIDMNNLPLVGATVRIKGKNSTTVSNERGYFELTTEPGSILLVSYVGFHDREFKVMNEQTIRIDLKQIDKTEKEVIISTGYEKISKERFVGAYSQLDSASYHRRAGMAILERLDGTVNGLFFNKKGYSDPTSNGIQIRGTSTLGLDGGPSLMDPLIVVDNFPMDARFNLNNINPNEVENITILKDAAATSIWGARAGNGVIVITTKRGKFNKPLQVSIASNITIENKPDLYYIPRISTNDFIEVEKYLYKQGFYSEKLDDIYYWPVVSPVVEIMDKLNKQQILEEEANFQISELGKTDVRNQLNEYIYKKAIRQQHYLNLNGGTNVFSYNFSFGFNANNPNIKHSKGSQQYTLTSSTNFRPVKNLDIQTTVNYSQNKSQPLPFSLPEQLAPYTRLADDAGNSLAIPYDIRTAYLDTLSAPGLLDWRYRLLDEIKLTKSTATDRLINFNVMVSYKITSWLNASVSYQYLSQTSISQNQNRLQSFFTRDLINRYFNPDPALKEDLRHPVPIGDILKTSITESTTKSGRASLNYNQRLGQHQLTAMFGAEASETKGYLQENQYFGYNDQNGSYRINMDFYNPYPLTYLAYPGDLNRISNNHVYRNQPFNRFASLYANASYSYKDRYTLYASARRDGANVFGVKTNNKWKPLWSIGSKWQISNESFFSADWIQLLALRASYGYAGNVNNASSGKLTMVYGLSPDFLTNLISADPQRANNPDLRWEKVGQFNAGIDFSVLKSRISGSLEIFKKKSEDVIALYPFDPTSGTELYAINSANLKGGGFELNISSINTVGKIKWTSNFGLSHSKMKVAKIYRSGYRAKDFIGYNLNVSEGKLIYGMSSYRWAGLDPLTGDPQGYLNGKVSKDYNAIANDSIQNQVYHGSSIPLCIANVGNTINFKGVTLSFTIVGKFNYYFRKPALNIRHTGELGGSNYTVDFGRRWQKPGDEKFTNVPSMMYPVQADLLDRPSFYEGAEINVLRADNIRLQDIRLQYDWINNKYHRIPFKSIQFFVYPNNLNMVFWRADTSALDPDFAGGFTNVTAAPPPKTWTVGISLNF